MENLTGKALAEYLLIHPEYANSECPWHTLCLTDWAKVLKVHPQLEQFRPQLPAESPYILLSVTEILDLHREFMENLKNAKKMDLCMINSENNPESAVYHRQKPKQTAGENPAERENKMNDGRRSVCENKSPLIDIIVEEVLLAYPGRVFSAREIYQELVARQLYRFSDDAKTPCNSICTRLSTGIQNRFPRLRRAGRGEYFAI